MWLLKGKSAQVGYILFRDRKLWWFESIRCCWPQSPFLLSTKAEDLRRLKGILAPPLLQDDEEDAKRYGLREAQLLTK